LRAIALPVTCKTTLNKQPRAAAAAAAAEEEEEKKVQLTLAASRTF
jgi:hypothetical protein